MVIVILLFLVFDITIPPGGVSRPLTVELWNSDTLTKDDLISSRTLDIKLFEGKTTKTV
jgi:hypothetical protein